MHTCINRDLPKKLYKYRPFNVFCLRLLTHGEISYSDSRLFNDPLDCGPIIEVDISRSALEHLCYAFLCNLKGNEQAKAEINNFRYLSSERGDYETDSSVQEYLRRMLAREVREKVNRAGFAGDSKA